VTERTAIILVHLNKRDDCVLEYWQLSKKRLSIVSHRTNLGLSVWFDCFLRSDAAVANAKNGCECSKADLARGLKSESAECCEEALRELDADDDEEAAWKGVTREAALAVAGRSVDS
jgi:hypothetical protein